MPSRSLAAGLLDDLIALPSVNPMGRAVAGPPYFEGRVTDYLAAFFRDLGVPCERMVVSEGRHNLLARFEPPEPAGLTLLWDAHQDTVPAEGMTVEPFRPTYRDGRIHGRGSCDVKGGLAAMLAAFSRLVRERPSGSARVILACTVDEEYTHTGSSALAGLDLGVDLAIVAEPTLLSLVNAHKGAVRWRLTTRGVACHSSRPGDGVNAIYRMARLLPWLEGEADRLAHAEPDPSLGPPSLSVGRIDGGQSVNIVPDRCTVELDRRTIPGERPDEVHRDLNERLARSLGDAVPIEASDPWVRMPALAPDSSRDWLGPARDVLADALGAPPPVLAVPYGTDAGPLSMAGIPSLVFGPGDIAQAHTKDEWIAPEQLDRAVDAYYALAVGLGRDTGP